jgi:N-acyl-D-aspartate/D-glutamate deacylase
MNDGQTHDLAILNGTLIDPSSNTQAPANLGVVGKQIVTISKEEIRGKREIDAQNLVISPGFIDILSPVRPTREAHLNKITDGVTTCIGMEGGPVDVAKYKKEMESASPLVNYAKAVGHIDLRKAAGAEDPYKPATEDQTRKMIELCRSALNEGAAGLGFAINYTPGASYEEVLALFQTASLFGVGCHLHARFKGNVFPLTMSLAVEEVIALSAATGAGAHLVHLASSTVGSANTCISLIEGASKHGVDLSFDFHVWTRNETTLQSALYDEGWQKHFGGISYENVYVASTQERLTKERFEELRRVKNNISVQAEFISEKEIEACLKSPLSIVASDGGGLVDGHGHPRSSGTFSRFLGLYVRDKKEISLMEAIRKITLLPANRMERSIPSMASKGRLVVGADADITIFDPATVRERATYQDPSLPSAGIEYVIVNGTVVLDEGEVLPGVSSGEWLGKRRSLEKKC